jgi:alkanesulfonate monooxygenase SsuD/methylene tetrahydromethanopterin reductase-like flavin-dependent oxidoreductase (luciferase family)
MPAFGIFDHIDKQSRPLSETYADRLRVLELADAAGFYSYHLAEHHATPLCMAPSPSIFLAALAQRTTRLRFGPLVYLLPMYDPLRLIEDVCMLDQLSNGRLDMGVGRGISPIELGIHGINPAETPARFREALEVLLAGLSLQPGERLNHAGQYYTFSNVPVELTPAQRPHPPVWYATSGPDRMPWLAERGYNTVVQGPAARVQPLLARYWEAWSQHHAADAPRPKFGILRTIFLADTDAAARALARPAFKQHYQSLTKLWVEHNMPTAAESFVDDLDDEIRDDKAYVGSPATVRDQLARFIEATGCEYVVARLMFGDLTRDELLHSVNLFVHEVMPSFQPSIAALA